MPLKTKTSTVVESAPDRERTSTQVERGVGLRVMWGVAAAAVVVVAAGIGWSSRDDHVPTAAGGAPRVVEPRVDPGTPLVSRPVGGTAEHGGEIRVSVPRVAVPVAGAGVWDPGAATVASAVFETLLVRDGNGVVHPWLADRVASDGTFETWSIHVRPGVVFSDGSPLTSVEVESSLRVMATSGSFLSADLIESVDLVDVSTVLVTLSEPVERFDEALAGQAGVISNDAGLGTGPFVPSEGSDSDSGRFVRNGQYWQRSSDGQLLPFADSVVFVEDSPFVNVAVFDSPDDEDRALAESGRDPLTPELGFRFADESWDGWGRASSIGVSPQPVTFSDGSSAPPVCATGLCVTTLALNGL